MRVSQGRGRGTGRTGGLRDRGGHGRLLRLNSARVAPSCIRIGHCSGQIVDRDVDVHHHLLAPIGGRPDRRHVPGEDWKASRTRYRGPLSLPHVLLLQNRPAEQAGIEVGERDAVGRLQNHAPPSVRDRRASTHLPPGLSRITIRSASSAVAPDPAEVTGWPSKNSSGNTGRRDEIISPTLMHLWTVSCV